jgi:predicted phage terminase large subunit-like protein
VTAGRYQRVIINVPPGTMKSLLVNVFWPAWEWSKQPELRHFSASYGSHLSIRDNLRVRDLVKSHEYMELFPKVQLKEDRNNKMRFDTTVGGWRIASSVYGVGTGEHPDRIIIDDPLTAQQARSDLERQAANDWFDRTLSTRGVIRGARVVVVMQRLHEEDLTGHLLAKGGFEHVCFPMEYELTREKDPDWRPDPRDPRTHPGELLWPAVFTGPIVRALARDLGPYGAAGQLQQRPAPEGGGLFQRDWFKIVDVAPVVARRIRGWDTAATEGAGDYTAGVRMAMTLDGRIYVEDVVRGQWSPNGVDNVMLLTAESDGNNVGQREEKEGAAAGKAVIQARSVLLNRFDYAGVQASGDKVTRSKPFRSQVEAGNVYLVKGAWNKDYLDELCDFPVGKNDDQVDGSSTAYNQLVIPGRRGGALW